MTDIIIRENREIATYKNKFLREATKKVYQIGETIRNACYKTAAIVYAVKEKKVYEEDGFKNVAEWAKDAFGFNKSTTYNLCNIGEKFTREIRDNKDKIVCYASNLIEDGNEDDYTISQVRELLPVGRDVALDMIDAGTISPDSTVKEIKAAVKDWLNKDSDPEPGEESGEETETSAEDPDIPEEELVLVTDENGNKYRVPADILKMYAI